MKRILVPSALVILGAVACQDNLVEPTFTLDTAELPTVTAAAPSGMNGVVARITGSGHYVTPPVGVDPGKWRVFTMHARKMADGSVSGSFTRVVHAQGMAPEKASGAITCFTVVGNKAWIGGYLNEEGHPDIAWQVMDNGQGKWADPDQMGLQFDESFGFPAGFAQDFCDDTPEELYFPIFDLNVVLADILADVESGNIQIEVK